MKSVHTIAGKLAERQFSKYTYIAVNALPLENNMIFNMVSFFTFSIRIHIMFNDNNDNDDTHSPQRRHINRICCAV